MKNRGSNAVGAALCGRPLTKGFPNSGAHRGAPLHSLSFLRKQESISFFKNHNWIPVFTGMTQSKFKGRLRREPSAERLGGILYNARGLSVLFLVIAMMLMVSIGYVFSYLIPTKQKSVLFPIQSNQAFFLAQSGVEFAVSYAKNQGWTTPTQLLGLNGGAVYQRNLGAGRFTINYNNTTDTLTSSGEVPIGTQRRQIVFSNFTSFLYYFTYRKPITVQAVQVINGPLTNFPMLVSRTDANLATVANGGHIASYNVATNDPWDLVFEALDDTTCGGAGTAPCRLAHQIEKYTASTGELVAWVQVPSINNGTIIYMYYGNSCITSSTQNASGVWDSNYKGVWHLNQGTGVNAADSTSNGNTGVQVDSPVASTGQIGGALTFSYPDRLTIAAASLDLTTYSNWTMSAWVRPTSYTGLKWPIIYSYGTYRASLGLTVQEAGADGRIENWTNDSVLRQSNTAVTLNAWNYVTITRTATTTSFYLNGSADGSGTSTTVTTAGQPSGIGGDPLGAADLTEHFLGLIDEVRVSASNTSSGSRSADWIHTEYHNQSAPSSFYSVGGEEN